MKAWQNFWGFFPALAIDRKNIFPQLMKQMLNRVVKKEKLFDDFKSISLYLLLQIDMLLSRFVDIYAINVIYPVVYVIFPYSGEC